MEKLMSYIAGMEKVMSYIAATGLKTTDLIEEA